MEDKAKKQSIEELESLRRKLAEKEEAGRRKEKALTLSERRLSRIVQENPIPTFPKEVCARLIELDRGQFILSTARDITGRKEAEGRIESTFIALAETISRTVTPTPQATSGG